MGRALQRLVPTLLLSLPGGLLGQEPVEAVLSGQLLRDAAPADSGLVVLHRVTPEEAGAIDSVAVGSDGRFRFTLPSLPVPGSGEVFFAASRYDGIVYSGAPIDRPVQLDSLYTVGTFRSEAAPPGGYQFPIWIREFWAVEGPMGWQITDAFIVRNPGEATFIPAAPGETVWRYPLPAGVRAFRVLESGPTPGEVRFEDGEIHASMPIIPGESYFMVQYELESLFTDLPLPGEVAIARIIVRDPAPPIRVEGLARQPPEELEVGVVFHQWVGEGLRDQVARILPGEEDLALSGWLSVSLALLLLLAGIWAVKRGEGRHGGSGAPAPHPASGPTRVRRDVLIDIARLDEGFQGGGDRGKRASERYRRHRAELLAELAGLTGGSDSDR